MAETIRTCPFCGGEAHIKEVVSACSVVYTVGCSDSECMGFETLLCKPTPEEAVAAWNRRAERTCHVVRDGRPSPTGVPSERHCSECGGALMVGDPTRNRRFCPNCGARIERGDE